MNMADNISGKSILLLCDNFYNYDIEIRNELLKLGAKKVYLKNIEFFQGSFREHVTWKTFYFYFKNPLERTRWTNELMREIEDMHFDIMFCIENMSFKKHFIDFLRLKNPNIKTFLFLWDTFKTQQPRYFDYLPKFDYVFSFDRNDAQKYGLIYFPDFYIDKENNILEPIYDLSFVGTMNDKSTFFRGHLLSKINKYCRENNLKTFLYLKYLKSKFNSNFIRVFIRKIIYYKYNNEINKYIKEGFLYEKSLSLEQVDKIFNQSKVILDLNHNNRQGMTINCITAIAKGKKLITTNKDIKNEDFYSPENIYIIDENNPILNIEFFKNEPQPIDLSHLRLDNWLKYILNR